jgi:raffinose/stachyose/melibiose transport system permease protein
MKGKIPEGFELGCFNLPVPRGSTQDATTVNVHVEPYFVMRKSGHPKLAVDFLRFMTSRRMAGKFARLQDIPVCTKGANEGNLSADLSDLMKIIATAKNSYGGVPGEGYPEMKQVDNDMMEKILNGRQTPQELATQMERFVVGVKNRQDRPDEVVVNHRTETVVLLSLLGLGAIVAAWNFFTKFRHARASVVEELQPMRFRNILLFVGPAVAIYTVFIIVPCLRSFSWSLHEWNGLTPMGSMPYKGMLNFRRLLLESDSFWIALKNNLFLMFVVPLFVVPLSMFLAASISRGIWGGKTFRVIFFFPNLLGGVAATLLWLHVYNPQGGLVNGALVALGFKSFEGFPWLAAHNLYWSLIPISIWGACGFNMVLYLAAMESIPRAITRRRGSTGRGPWRQFWTITLPLIWEVLAISLVFLIIGGMKAFEIIWLLTTSSPIPIRT